MTKEDVERIKNNPQYQKLVKERSRYAWRLSAVMFLAYYAFIMMIAFMPEVLGVKLSGSVITLGIPLGIAIIFLSFILSGLYVKRANGRFDQLTQEVKDAYIKGAE